VIRSRQNRWKRPILLADRQSRPSVERPRSDPRRSTGDFPVRQKASLFLLFALGLIGGAPGLAAANGPSLDELLGLTDPEPEQQEAQEAQPADGEESPDNQSPSNGPEAPIELSPDVARTLNDADPGDLLHSALQDLTDVADRLEQDLDPGPNTQRRQQVAIQKLAQAIEAAENQQQQQQQSQGGGGGQSGQNARQQDTGGANNAQSNSQAGQQQGGQGEQQASANAQGGTNPDGDGPPPGSEDEAGTQDGELESGRVEWGNLPPRIREQLHQGMRQGFSSVYKRLTESYYKRLSEEAQE